jgi:hypothetical protein
VEFAEKRKAAAVKALRIGHGCAQILIQPIEVAKVLNWEIA